MLSNTKSIENCERNIQQGSLGRDIAFAKIQELKQNFIMLNQNVKDELDIIRKSVDNDRDTGRTNPKT